MSKRTPWRIRVCQFCNREFRAARWDAKSCSPKCRQQLCRALARNRKTATH